MEAFSNYRPHADEYINSGTVGHGGLYLTDDILLAHADNGFHRRAVVAVDDVFFGQHVGGGDGHGTYLAEGKHGDPPLQAALQDEHHHVTMSDA